MNNLIVSKFGGSSVRDAQAMIRCARIVQDNPEIRLVIISATYNTTNRLEQMAGLASTGKKEEALRLLAQLREEHFSIAEQIDANDETILYLEEFLGEGESLLEGMSLLGEKSARAMDRLYSIGERMSSALFAGILNQMMQGEREVIYFDVRKVLKTNSDFSRALPDIERIKYESEACLLPILQDSDSIVVTQGFIGEDLNGATTTLGREGSDFSAALLAEATSANLLQIWTDVPGVATTDPKRIAHACIIPDMTYDEATTMAHLGAKVLFPKTIKPLLRENIPLYVGSSLHPEKEGTWIQKEASYLPLLRSLAVLDNQELVVVTSNNLLPMNLFYRDVFAVISEAKIDFNFLNLTGNTISFLMKETEQTDFLKALGNVAQVKRERDLSLVSLIGNEMEQASHLLADIFTSLSKRSVRMIQLGGSDHSLSLLVPKKEADGVLEELHNLLLNLAATDGYNLRVLS